MISQRSCLCVFLTCLVLSASFMVSVEGQNAVETYSFTGSTQTYTVPLGVYFVTVEGWGAGGAGATSTGYGGAGAYGQGVISGLKPGDTLDIVVGSGSLTESNCAGGNGGGRSAVFVNDVEVFTAGGGGGGSTACVGSDADINNNMCLFSLFSGTDGTSLAGTGGDNTVSFDEGSSGQGGDASDRSTTATKAFGGGGACGLQGGGGGGGGYFGGGGGGRVADAGAGGAGAGGAGSSYALGTSPYPVDAVFNGAPGPATAPGSASPNYVSGVAVGGQAHATASQRNGGNGLVVLTISSSCPAPPGLLAEQYDPTIDTTKSGLSLDNGEPIITIFVDLPGHYYDVDLQFEDCTIGCTSTVSVTPNNECYSGRNSDADIGCNRQYKIRMPYSKFCSFTVTDGTDDNGDPVYEFSGTVTASAKVVLDGTFDGGAVVRELSKPLNWVVELQKQVTVTSQIMISSTCSCITAADCSETPQTLSHGSCDCTCTCDAGFTGSNCGEDIQEPVVTCPDNMIIYLDIGDLSSAFLTNTVNTIRPYNLEGFPLSFTDNQEAWQAIEVRRVISFGSTVFPVQTFDTTQSLGTWPNTDNVLTYNFNQLGTWTIQYHVSDAATPVNTNSDCSFTVTVKDTGAPTYPNCPSGLQGSYSDASAMLTAFNDVKNTATDNIVASADIQHTNGLSATYTGETSPADVREHTIALIADDQSSDSVDGTCTFTMWFDNVSPVCSGSSHPSIQKTFQITQSTPNPTCFTIDLTQISTEITWSDTVNDVTGVGIDTALYPLTLSPLGFDATCHSVGVHSVQALQKDTLGNEGSCHLSFRVEDKVAPVPECGSGSINVNTDPGKDFATVNWDTLVGTTWGFTVTDNLDTFNGNCWTNAGAQPQCALSKDGSSIAVGSSVTFDHGASYTVTFDVQDQFSNPATCTMTVNVIDNENPTAICPTSDVEIPADGTCQGVFNPVSQDLTTTAAVYDAFTVTHNDNVAIRTDVPPTLTGVGESYALDVPKSHTYTVLDTSNRPGTCSFNTIMVDRTPPSISCPAAFSVPMDADSSKFTAPATLSDWTAAYPTSFSDNCASPTPTGMIQFHGESTYVTIESTYVTIPGQLQLSAGTHTIQWAMNDGINPEQTCTVSVTVQDLEDPVCTGTDLTNILITAAGLASFDLNTAVSDIKDNVAVNSGLGGRAAFSCVSGCTSIVWDDALSTFASFGLGVYRLQYTVTDTATPARTGVCFFTVNVNPICGDTVRHGNEECDTGLGVVDSCTDGTCVCDTNYDPIDHVCGANNVFENCAHDCHNRDCTGIPLPVESDLTDTCTIEVDTSDLTSNDYLIVPTLNLDTTHELSSVLTNPSTFKLLFGDNTSNTQTIEAGKHVTIKICCGDRPLRLYKLDDGQCTNSNSVWSYSKSGAYANAADSCAGLSLLSPRSSSDGTCTVWDICEGGSYAFGEAPAVDIATCKSPSHTEQITTYVQHNVASETKKTITTWPLQSSIFTIGGGYIQVMNEADILENERVYVSKDHADNYEFPLGSTTVTYTIKESATSSVQCQLIVVVEDKASPIVSCPIGPLAKYNDAGLATTSYSLGLGTTHTAYDNDPGQGTTGMTTTVTMALNGGAEIDISGLTSVFLTANTDGLLNTYTFRFSATDGNGNGPSPCLWEVTMDDNEKPVFACPSNAVEQVTANRGAYVYTFPSLDTTDNVYPLTGFVTSFTVNGVSYNSNTTPTADLPIGVNALTAAYSDAHGQTAVACQWSVTVQDTQPTFTTCDTTAVTLQYTDTPIVISHTSINGGSWTGEDNCGDITDGSLTGAPSDASCVGQVSYAVSITNQLGESITDSSSTAWDTSITVGPVNRPLGTYTVSISFRDCSGIGCVPTDTATCSFTVTVKDNVKPVPSCPADLSFTLTDADYTGTNTKTVDYSFHDNYVASPPSATDNWDGPLSQVPSGTGFTLPTNPSITIGTPFTVNVVATDSSINSDTCTFDVTLLDGVKPVLTCPASVTVYSATPTWSLPTVTDNYDTYDFVADADSRLQQTFGPLLGSGTLRLGANAITYEASDASTNTGTCSFTITYEDNVPPDVTCPSSSTITQTQASSYTWAVSGIDAIDGTNLAWYTDSGKTISTTTLSGDGNSLTLPAGFGQKDFNFAFIACDQSNVCSTITACSWTVTVTDDTKPVVVCPIDQTRQVSMTGTDSVVVNFNTLITLGAEGNYDVHSGYNTHEFLPASGSTFTLTDANVAQTFIITLTVTDNRNNADSCQFTLSVNPKYAGAGPQAVLTSVFISEIDEDGTPAYQATIQFMTAVSTPWKLSVANAAPTGSGDITDATPETSLTVCPVTTFGASCRQVWSSAITFDDCILSQSVYAYQFVADCLDGAYGPCEGSSQGYTVSITLSADNFCGENLQTVSITASMVTTASENRAAYVTANSNAFSTACAYNAQDTGGCIDKLTAFPGTGGLIGNLVFVDSPQALLSDVRVIAATRINYGEAARTTVVNELNALEAPQYSDSQHPNYATFTYEEAPIPLETTYYATIEATVEVEYNLGNTQRRRLLSFEREEQAKTGRNLLQNTPAGSQPVKASTQFISLRLNDGSGREISGDYESFRTIRLTGDYSTSDLTDMESVIDTILDGLNLGDVVNVIPGTVSDVYMEVGGTDGQMANLLSQSTNATSLVSVLAKNEGWIIDNSFVSNRRLSADASGPLAPACSVEDSSDSQTKTALIAVTVVGWILCLVFTILFARSSNKKDETQDKLDELTRRSSKIDGSGNVIVMPVMPSEPIKPKRRGSISPMSSQNGADRVNNDDVSQNTGRISRSDSLENNYLTLKPLPPLTGAAAAKNIPNQLPM